jgi:(R,R)-butanediol dehydrogenase/meso-butanediol dehydrogenase/diacetyl reductase
MKAARLHGIGDIRIETVADPGAPGPGEVLLRVLAAGICGSDLHNFRTGQWFARLPVTPGHELAGEVVAVGAGVETVRPGDLVVADSRVPCGACEHCRAGRGNLCVRLGYVGEVCEGGFAEAVNLPARALLRVDPAVPPAVAALSEPLGVALHVRRRLDPAPDAPILVVGCGPIGGLAALVLAEAGFGPVLVADRNPGRLALVAEVAGAVPVALEREAVLAATGGRGVGFAVEATGSTAALSALLGIVANGARIALVGIFHGKLELDPNVIVEREIDLRGCAVFADEQREAVNLLPALAARLERLVAPAIGLDALPEAYATLIAGGGAALKTIVTP